MRSSRPRPSSPSAGATYLDRAATVEALRRAAREAVRRDPRIVRVILFGSLVRGVPTPASDADLVVVLREAEPRRMDRIPPLLDAFDATPLPLDLHPYSEAEWEAARAEGDPVAAVAERDGIDLL